LAYLVEFDERVSKDLDKLSLGIARTVIERCSALGVNPLQGPGIKRLSSNLYRLWKCGMSGEWFTWWKAPKYWFFLLATAKIAMTVCAGAYSPQ